MEKEEILKKVIECAKRYRENLENKNILFVYYENSKVKYIETKFTESNFLHLTGLEYERKINGNIIKKSTIFYKDIINKKVSIHNIKIKNKDIIKLKLDILYNLMNINYSAKIIGEYDERTKKLLVTDKVIGNTRYCIGFKKVNGCYVPNTSLKEDIRKICRNTNKIEAIFCKKIKEIKYKNVTYLENKINLSQLLKNENLKKLIDETGLYSTNNLYNQKIFEYLSNKV